MGSKGRAGAVRIEAVDSHLAGPLQESVVKPHGFLDTCSETFLSHGQKAVLGPAGDGVMVGRMVSC